MKRYRITIMIGGLMFLAGLAIGLLLSAMRASMLQMDSQESEQCQITQGLVKSTLDNKEECCLCVNILALQYPDSGKLSTDVPDVDTGIDWLVYLARYSQQCQAQSHFVVRSRLDIVENTEIMVGPNQSFYCGTLRPDCRPFRTGIFSVPATVGA